MTKKQLANLAADHLRVNGFPAQYIAIDIRQFAAFRASIYVPGLRNIRIEHFKVHGFTIGYTCRGKAYNIQIIWRGSVIA